MHLCSERVYEYVCIDMRLPVLGASPSSQVYVIYGAVYFQLSHGGENIFISLYCHLQIGNMNYCFEVGHETNVRIGYLAMFPENPNLSANARCANFRISEKTPVVISDLHSESLTRATTSVQGKLLQEISFVRLAHYSWRMSWFTMVTWQNLNRGKTWSHQKDTRQPSGTSLN